MSFAKFFSDNFSLHGRRNRVQYVVATVISLVCGALMAVAEQADAAAIAGPFMFASNIYWLSNFMRRLRDIGLGTLVSIPLVIALIIAVIFATSQQQSPIAGIFGLVCVLLPMLIPAWDHQHGLTHLIAVLRRVATIDGEITDAERQVMQRLCDEWFGMPDHVKERTMRDFNAGHQDTISVDKHLSAFKAKYGKNEDRKADFACMVWMMARSNGNPSHEREKLARHVTQSLGVRGEEERSQSYQANQDQNRWDADILPPRANNIVGLLAKMAKADGEIKKSEIQMISDFFEFGMRLTPDLKKAAISYFGTVKNDSHSFKHYADLCIRDVMQIPASQAEEAKHGIFGLLLELASADGEIHEREAEILEYVADKFGISDEFGGGQQRDTGAGNRSERTSSASGNKDEQHYAKILQISPNASKDEIKKAWREMIKSNHPDKVSHMSQAIQAFAAEQTKLGQEAYEFFKQRGRA